MKLLIPIMLCVSLIACQIKADEPEKIDHHSLAALLNANIPHEKPEFQPAAGIAVGAVVICVGGYCIYKMVKVCQKAFPPKSTNSNDGFMASAADEYAGAYEYSSIGSCYTPPDLRRVSSYEDLPSPATTFTLNVMVEPAGVTTSMSAGKEETAQTWTEFQAEMAGHGLFLTGRSSWLPQFSRNGAPCDGALVPLEFDPLTGRVTQHTDGEMSRVVVERSPNLIDWAPLLVTDVGVGSVFKVVDTTREGQMFYRVSVL